MVAPGVGGRRDDTGTGITNETAKFAKVVRVVSMVVEVSTAAEVSTAVEVSTVAGLDRVHEANIKVGVRAMEALVVAVGKQYAMTSKTVMIATVVTRVVMVRGMTGRLADMGEVTSHPVVVMVAALSRPVTAVRNRLVVTDAVRSHLVTVVVTSVVRNRLVTDAVLNRPVTVADTDVVRNRAMTEVRSRLVTDAVQNRPAVTVVVTNPRAARRDITIQLVFVPATTNVDEAMTTNVAATDAVMTTANAPVVGKNAAGGIALQMQSPRGLATRKRNADAAWTSSANAAGVDQRAIADLTNGSRKTSTNVSPTTITSTHRRSS